MKQPNRVVRVGRASIVDWLARTRQRWSEMPRVSSDVAHQPGTQREKKKNKKNKFSLFSSGNTLPFSRYLSTRQFFLCHCYAASYSIRRERAGVTCVVVLNWTCRRRFLIERQQRDPRCAAADQLYTLEWKRKDGKRNKRVNQNKPQQKNNQTCMNGPHLLIIFIGIGVGASPLNERTKKTWPRCFFFFFFFPFSHSHLAVMFRAAATKRYTIGADCLISISKREKMAVAYGAFDSDRSQHRIWFNMNVGWMGLRSPTATFHPSGRTPSPRCYAIRQWTNDVAPRQIRHSGRFRFGPIMDRFLTSGIKIREKERENTATEKNDPVQVVRDFASSATSIFLFPRSGRSRRWNKRRGRRKEGFRWFNFLQLIIIPNKF